METILWTCVEAKKLINNVYMSKVDNQVKIELVEIYREHTPKNCKFLDAKAD